MKYTLKVFGVPVVSFSREADEYDLLITGCLDVSEDEEQFSDAVDPEFGFRVSDG